MNIKTNEILLLNKIRLEGDKNTNTATLEPIADEASAEKGMKALMFQGMKNLMSNPNLAMETGVADEVLPKEMGDADGYIAPYKSNLAFGHSPKYIKNGAKVLAGLALAGGVAAGVTSCKPFEEGDTIVTQQVTIDFTEFFQIMSQFLAQQSAENEKNRAILQQMQQTLLEILASNKTQEQKFDEIFQHFIMIEANQEIIRQQLVVNGMKQDDANKFLQDLITAVNNHTMTAQEAWQQIIDRLDLTNAILNNIYNTIKESLAKLIAQGAEANEIATGILNNTAATNDKLDELNKNVTGVANELVNIRLSNETIGANIQAAIAQQTVQINDNVSSNIAALAQAVHMDIDDFKATMVRMGITEMQLQKMSVYELLKAIDKNTNEIKNLQNIVNTLLYEYQQGKISAEQFAQKVIDAMTQMNATLADISATLKEVNANINALRKDMKDQTKKIINNQDRSYGMLNQLVNNTNGLGEQLTAIQTSLETFATRVETAIKESTISQNANVDANFEKLAGIVKMSEEDLKALLVQMHISDQQLQTMSVAQLLKAINANTKEVKSIKDSVNSFLEEYKAGKLTAEQFAQKILDALNLIDAKLGTLIAELSDARAELMDKLNEIMDVMNSNASYLGAKIDDSKDFIGNKLDVMIDGQQTIVTTINEAVKEGVLSVNDNVNANFEKIANVIGMSTSDLKSLLVQMHISDQTLQTMSVNALLTAINANTSEVKNLKASFDNFVKQYEANQITAQQFAQKVIELLGNISDKLDMIMAQLSDARSEIMAKLNEIANSTANIDANTQVIGDKLDVVIQGQTAAADRIENAIKEGTISQNTNVTANFDKLAEIVGMTAADFKDLLVQMHISDQDLQKMSTSALLNAIRQNTNEVKNLKASFNNFVKQYQAGQITAQQLANKIIDLLSEISAKLDNISAQITQGFANLLAAQKEANKTLVKIDGNTTITNAYLNELNTNVKLALEAQNDYKQDFADLKALAKDNNTYQAQILAELKSHPEQYKDMLNKLGISVNQAINMSASQFTAKIDEAMAKYDKTEGKQTQLLVDIYNAIEKHQGETFDDTNIINAINALKAALNGNTTTINAKLQAILDALNEISAKLDGISGQITQLYNDVVALLKDANTTLTELKGGQTITNSYLNKLNKNVEDLKAAQKDYKQDFADLKALAKDQITYENEILNELKSHPDKYKDMLSKLGISVNQAINMSASQFSAKIDEAMKLYDKVEGKQIELLIEIYNELKTHQGGTIDDSKIIAAINALKADMNADAATVNAKLQAILDALKGISGQLDDLINEVKALSSTVRQMNTYLNNFNTYWTQALGSLGDYANDLAEIKTLLKAGNTNTAAVKAKLDEIKADLEAMKASQARAEAFLSGIQTNSQIIINKLDQFKDIDYDKIEQAMKNVSDTDYQRYKELLEKLAIDPAKFESVKELIQAIKDGVADIQIDTKYGKKIYDILKDVDWTNPANIAKLDQIINILNNLKVNCQCSCNGGNPDEGGHNVDDLDDLING